MATIFINYRAQEHAGYAALLDQVLSHRFGADTVFRAPRSLRPGDDFAEEIISNVRACTVLLAVIGPDWLNPARAVMRDATDWVHREISEALGQRIRVIPVLVEDAHLPAAEQLPKEIAALARCHAVQIHDGSVEPDIARIISEIESVVSELQDLRDPATEAIAPDIRLFRLATPSTTQVTIGVVPGSILRVKFADIWVNSENTDMEMARFSEFSMSAIIRYYGAKTDDAGQVIDDTIARELSERLGTHRPVLPGTAVVTGPGSLRESHNVRHLIHVASVQGEPGAGFRQVRNVGACVVNALTTAGQLADTDPAVRTVLLPLFGTGAAKASVGKTIPALLNSAIHYVTINPDTHLRTVYFLAYTIRELRKFDRIIFDMPSLIPMHSKHWPQRI